MEAFSADAAARTDSIDAAARAKCRWLGGRCAYILAHDPIPKVKDLKFEPVPVANKSVKIQGPNKRQQLLAALAAEQDITRLRDISGSSRQMPKTCALNVRHALCMHSRSTLAL